MNPEIRTPTRVLVIDDSEPIHALIKARLQPEGLEVSGELDGEAGIERAMQDLPDLILLDVDMPELDGFEVCRRLKNTPSTRDIPIIFLTGTASTDSKVRGLDMGAIDYVTKPFDQVELRARVRAGLRTKHLQDILEHQSFLDPLTGLWNRAYLDRRMEGEINIASRYDRPLGVALLDLDCFKTLNDTYGHLFGDVVLQGVARVMKESARTSDTVARYGGEEFAILIPQADLRATTQVAERVRQAIESHSFDLRGSKVSITASIGVVCTADFVGELSPENLLSHADRALYASKDAGRNCTYLNVRGRIRPLESEDR